MAYISTQMESQMKKNEELEAQIGEKRNRIDKLASDTEIYYNIILGFTWSSQSLVGHPPNSIRSIKEFLVEETNVQ